MKESRHASVTTCLLHTGGQAHNGTRIPVRADTAYSNFECFCMFIRNMPLNIRAGGNSTVLLR